MQVSLYTSLAPRVFLAAYTRSEEPYGPFLFSNLVSNFVSLSTFLLHLKLQERSRAPVMSKSSVYATYTNVESLPDVVIFNIHIVRTITVNES